jgi:chaperonin cofactor prefoldin
MSEVIERREKLAIELTQAAFAGDENVEVDDDAAVSKGDGGVYVEAWVWVSDSQVDEKIGELS